MKQSVIPRQLLALGILSGLALSATLKALRGGPVSIMPRKGQTVASVLCQGKPANAKLNPDGSAVIETKSERTYEVRFNQTR